MQNLCKELNKMLLDESKHEIFNDIVKIDMDVKPLNDGQIVVISDVNRAALTLTTSKGEKKNLNVITKVEPSTQLVKDMISKSEIFNYEKKMYCSVLKSMEALMSEIGDKDLLWANCYFAGNCKFIFQDLCDIGYKIVPTRMFLDYDHTMIAMKAIGKFHGLSMVLKSRDCFDESQLKPYFLGEKKPMVTNWYKLSAVNLSRAMMEWCDEWKTSANNLNKLGENPGELLHDMCESFKGQWCVLNHGDFSMRNMLFHYPSGSTIPDNIKFVDFQACHYSHFAFDLAYLLYGSVKPQLRDDNMHSFLKVYIDSLCATCKMYNFNGKIPTVEIALSSLKAMSVYTTFNSISTIPFFLTSGKMDAQKRAEDWMEKFTSHDMPGEVLSKRENLYLIDDEVAKEIKYEVHRLIAEKII